ncbi:D-cysteine desulfhydrase family protein [Roseovarius sp. CAU 1744]|uniref:D-cysteine desulfhydrase family protein n=1 Tax=Roseovarius sp. CAU 1744 TaxID=3140368 RepID=UPI00325BC057
MSAILDRVAAFPRTGLVSGPTPLEPLPRLSEHLGVELWIKRDDLTGLGGGGNKIRQLEFYLGAAQADAADTILITGAVQSNYVRCAAAAAAKCGMKAVLQLEERVAGKGENYRRSGNVLLARLLGAEHIHYPVGEDEAGADKALRDHADRLRQQGRRPYVIPLGLRNKPLGALGYMRAAQEVLAEDTGFDAAVIPSGSGATHVGFLAGLRALGSGMPVHGICVRRNAAAQSARLQELSDRLAALLGVTPWLRAEDIRTHDNALAPGYGQVSPGLRAAIHLMVRYEGLFLDPVYSGKCLAGLIDLIGRGEIAPGSRVLFIHTGGFPALFAYQDELLNG